jgi:hypothetical protein
MGVSVIEAGGGSGVFLFRGQGWSGVLGSTLARKGVVIFSSVRVVRVVRDNMGEL